MFSKTLSRVSKFNFRLHIRIMWDATNWVRECNYDLDKAIDYKKRGDLYFVLKQYRPLFVKYTPTEH